MRTPSRETAAGNDERLLDEQAYRTAFDSMGEGFYLTELVVDDEGRPVDLVYLDSNAAAARITKVECRGRRLSEVNPSFDPFWLELWARVARTGASERFTRRSSFVDRWLEFNVFRIGGDGSRRVAVIFDDVTERERAAAQLRENDARQTFLLALSDALRHLADPDAIQSAATRLLCERLGIARAFYAECQDREGLGVVRTEHVRDAPSVVGVYRFDDIPWTAQALRSGRPLVIDDALAALDMAQSERDWYAATSTRAVVSVPLLKAGKLVAALTVSETSPRAWTARDIALVQETAERTWAAVERARVLAQSQAAHQEAERAMRIRDEFLAVVSHELRTPLAAIVLWSNLLLKGAVQPAHQARAFASIASSAAAQQKLIEDLLDLSRMLAGQLRIAIREAELAPIVEAAIEAVRPTAAAKRVSLSADLDARAIRARVDPDRLQQVVWNLVNNAVKFTPANGRVHVRLEADGRLVRIDVNDTGQGIAPEFLPYVFDRFRQADASITRAQGGLGLGLAIARQLVELHGGTVSATSAGAGRGATFTVELPGIDADAEDAAPRPASERPSTSTMPLEPALAGTRVLLVEDEAETRDALYWVLQRCGAEVTATSSADEALLAFELGSEARFDALVSDIGLPGQDGYALLEALRRRPAGAGLPALALTAYARESDRSRALAAGFSAYLAKPVEPRSLVDTVAALARRAANG